MNWLKWLTLGAAVLVLVVSLMPYGLSVDCGICGVAGGLVEIVGLQQIEIVRSIHSLPCSPWTLSAINLSIFTRNAMLTIGEHQLIGYFDTGGDICLVLRHLSTGKMDHRRIANPMSDAALGDAHKSLNLGYSADGFIHAVFGAHGDRPFYYQLDWPDLSITSRDADQLNLTSAHITYPQFYYIDGDLVLLYRDDTNRAYSLNRYDARAGMWYQWRPRFLEIPSDTQSVYLNSLGIYEQTIAIAYTLRLPDDQKPPRVLNEDLRVIFSLDAGESWYSFNGVLLSLPIDAKRPPVTIRVPAGRNLCNQAGAWLGPDGVFWIVYYADDNNGIPQVFVSEIDLFAAEIRGSRISNQASDFDLTGHGTLHSLPLSRPTVLNILDQIVALWRQNNTILLATRPMRQGSFPWTTFYLAFSGMIKNWEPILDFTRLQENVITLFVHGAEQGDADTNFPAGIDTPAVLVDLWLRPFDVAQRESPLIH